MVWPPGTCTLYALDLEMRGMESHTIFISAATPMGYRGMKAEYLRGGEEWISPNCSFIQLKHKPACTWKDPGARRHAMCRSRPCLSHASMGTDFPMMTEA